MVEFGPARFSIQDAEHGRYDGLPLSGPITDTFGNLTPFRQQHNLGPHGGVDIAAPEGTPIHAPAEGVVIAIDVHPDLGNYLTLRHADNTWSAYCHLVRPATLPIGTSVNRGDVLGFVGMTGTADGNHLHWVHTKPNPRGLLKADMVDALKSVREAIGGEPPVQPQQPAQPQVQPVPAAAGGSTIAVEIYEVQSGDNLTAIAGRWGCTVDAICQLNGIANPDRIFAGQKLRRP